jgi:hypothetical protein
MVQSHSPVTSRRSSPRGFVGEGVMSNLNTRSVPATPLGAVAHNAGTTAAPGIGPKPAAQGLQMGQDQAGINPYVGLGVSGELNNRYSGSNFDSPGGYGLQHGIDDRVCPPNDAFVHMLIFGYLSLGLTASTELVLAVIRESLEASVMDTITVVGECTMDLITLPAMVPCHQEIVVSVEMAS